MAAHMPLTHGVATQLPSSQTGLSWGHWLPQPPQFAGSSLVSVHIPLQHVS
jgi:hypothetical protein